MNYFVGAVLLYALYFLLCYLGTGSESKNMRATNFYSYPDSVQDRIRQDERLGKMVPPQRNYGKVFFSNLLLFTAAFVVMGLLLSIREFTAAVLYFLAVGGGLNLFDLLVIDMCWWRHSSRVRIRGIGDDADYRDMHRHIGAFLRAIPMFAAAAVLAAGIIGFFF